MRFKIVVVGLIMVLGFSGCDSSTNISKNIIKQEEKQMLNEIYQTKTISGRAEMVEQVVAKYFILGIDKSTVVAKLKGMNVEYSLDATENTIYVLHRNKEAYLPGSKTMEIVFYFDKNNKLVRIFSRIYNTI